MSFTCVNHRMLWLRSLGAMATAALFFGSIAQFPKSESAYEQRRQWGWCRVRVDQCGRE